MVPDYDIADFAFPVDKYAYLAVYFPGELGDVPGELMGNDLIGGYSSSIKLLNFLELA